MRYLLVLLALISAAAFAGSGDKMTGDGSWINGQGNTMYAQFDVHEANGQKEVKGSHYQEVDSGAGTIYAAIDTADIDVDSGRACYGGVITEATGITSNRVGERLWVTVLDGGDARLEVGGDKLQAGIFPAYRTAPPAFCTHNAFGQNQPFFEGNAQLHRGS